MSTKSWWKIHVCNSILFVETHNFTTNTGRVTRREKEMQKFLKSEIFWITNLKKGIEVVFLVRQIGNTSLARHHFSTREEIKWFPSQWTEYNWVLRPPHRTAPQRHRPSITLRYAPNTSVSLSLIPFSDCPWGSHLCLKEASKQVGNEWREA
jgi:hypothetical protein